MSVLNRHLLRALSVRRRKKTSHRDPAALNALLLSLGLGAIRVRSFPPGLGLEHLADLDFPWA